MQNRLVAETTQTLVAMHNLNLLANYNVAKHGEEGEHRRHGRLAVDYEEGDVVDLEAIGKVTHAGAAFVGMGDYDDLVAAVYKFLYVRQQPQSKVPNTCNAHCRDLVYVTFYSACDCQRWSRTLLEMTHLAGGKKSHLSY